MGQLVGLFIPQNGQEDISQLAQQNQELKKANDSLQRKVQEVQKIQEKNDSLKAQLTASHRSFYEIQRQKEILNTQLSASKDETHVSRQQYESLNTEVQRTRRELSVERATNKDLREGMAKLRLMLVPSSESQISDSDIISKFTALRSLTLRLVKGTWSMRFKNDIDMRRWSDWQRNVFGPFADQTSHWQTLHNKLRSLIFDFIGIYVLNCRHYYLKHNCIRLDKVLGDAEDYICDSLPEGT